MVLLGGFSTRGILVGKIFFVEKFLSVVVIVLLVVRTALMVVVSWPKLDFDASSSRFSSSLQKSVLQRQAKIDPEPSSVISLCEQSGKGTRGSWIEPSKTRVGKHSRNVAER